MAFAQFTYRKSLRDIGACLRSAGGKPNRMGLRGKVTSSTLADANKNRDWRVFADFAKVPIGIARPLYAHDPIGVELIQSLCAFDSTAIDLHLSLFPLQSRGMRGSGGCQSGCDSDGQDGILVLPPMRNSR